MVVLNRKWTPEEDNCLKEVVNSYRMGDIIPWSYGNETFLLHLVTNILEVIRECKILNCRINSLLIYVDVYLY